MVQVIPGRGTAGGEQPPAPAGRLPNDSLAEFLDGDYRRLVAGLALVAGSRAAAEDAVQEALARAWERGMRGEQITSLGGFVAVVATNLLRSRFRRLLCGARSSGWPTRSTPAACWRRCNGGHGADGHGAGRGWPR